MEVFLEARKLLDTQSIREIWIHLEDILKMGYNINDIIELGPPYKNFFVDYHERLLKLGADASNLFHKVRGRYEQLVCFPDLIAHDFKTFVKYGLDKKVAKAWIKAHIKHEDFVNYPNTFKFFGIEAKEYIPAYLDSHELSENWNHILYGLAKPTPEDFVEFYGIAPIAEAFRYSSSKTSKGLSVFIEEYASQGADMDFLARKVLDVYGGYPKDESKLVVLITLLRNGAKIIDPNKIIDSLTYTAYNYKDRFSIRIVNNYFYDNLRGYADEAHLKKLEDN